MVRKYLQNGLIGATGLILVGARLGRGTDQNGPVLTAAARIVAGIDSGRAVRIGDVTGVARAGAETRVARDTRNALGALE